MTTIIRVDPEPDGPSRPEADVRDQADLPDYARRLQLQHAAFESEYAACLSEFLSNVNRTKAADIACGDGGFTRLLARIDGVQEAVGFDNDDDYLRAARALSPGSRSGLRYARLDVTDPADLGGARDAFDVVFCADSFQSILDHDSLVQTMIAMARPGGRVWVTETDNAHDLIVSIPVDVDVRLRRLELQNLSGVKSDGYAFPRKAIGLFRAHGLSDVRVQATSLTRTGPIDDAARAWLDHHMADRIDALDLSDDDPVRRHAHPDGDRYFAKDDDALVTYLRYWIEGRKAS